MWQVEVSQLEREAGQEGRPARQGTCRERDPGSQRGRKGGPRLECSRQRKEWACHIQSQEEANEGKAQ